VKYTVPLISNPKIKDYTTNKIVKLVQKVSWWYQRS